MEGTLARGLAYPNQYYTPKYTDVSSLSHLDRTALVGTHKAV